MATTPPVHRFQWRRPSAPLRLDLPGEISEHEQRTGYPPEIATYTLHWRYLDLLDCTVYGVRRGLASDDDDGGDWFTVVLWGCSDSLPFFTTFFKSRAWGNPTDMRFLEAVWDHWEMPGSLDWDEVFRKVMATYWPSRDHGIPVAEPPLYRRSFSEVVARLMACEPVPDA